MNRADRIADCTLGMTACLQTFVNCDCHVLRVIQCIEDTDNVNSVFNRLTDESAHCIIGIMLISENVLPSQQHLKLRILHFGTNEAESFPRIFVKITKT